VTSCGLGIHDLHRASRHALRELTGNDRVSSRKANGLTEYRWGRASGGEIPAEAVAEGHGWDYVTKDGQAVDRAAAWRAAQDGYVRVPVWLARSLPDASGNVLICRVRPGYGAALCGRERSRRIDDYEVLLDVGTWIWPDGDDWGAPMRPANAVACGQSGGPIYAALDIADDEEPQIPYDFVLAEDNRCKVLVDPDLSARPMVGVPHEQEEEESEPEQEATPAQAVAEPAGAVAYRWERASGGEIPRGACEQGHGWRWRDTDDGGQEKEWLWIARSLLDETGGVRLGYVARGEAAVVGPEYHEQPVDEYEVLLDAANWEWAEWIEEEDGSCFEDVGRNGLACGRSADGTLLYVTLRDREGEGYQPGENPARADCNFSRMVLKAPVGALATIPAPPAAPVGPRVVISALDCKNEVVEIANTGDAELDLGGWKLHDDGSRKGYVFPAGTKVVPGATVRVRSGPGAATLLPGDLKWKNASVWNDKGDTAYLEDPAGTLVSSKKG
jgi:Lamin Tail Domain